ncbi:UNVERIFIED_CONTAM: hypothetical protein PYX00_003725 [Menopon gallinae]|uniref:Uncharacterized protein n=1 Tax=Menopon gallinae TaxID=328185 RepID=A0AAW2I1I0_9NEOP
MVAGGKLSTGGSGGASQPITLSCTRQRSRQGSEVNKTAPSTYKLSKKGFLDIKRATLQIYFDSSCDCSYILMSSVVKHCG